MFVALLLYAQCTAAVRLASREYVDRKVGSAGVNVIKKQVSGLNKVDINLTKSGSYYFNIGNEITVGDVKKYGIHAEGIDSKNMKDITDDYTFIEQNDDHALILQGSKKSYYMLCSLLTPENGDDTKVCFIYFCGETECSKKFEPGGVTAYFVIPYEAVDENDTGDVYSALKTEEVIKDISGIVVRSTLPVEVPMDLRSNTTSGYSAFIADTVITYNDMKQHGLSIGSNSISYKTGSSRDNAYTISGKYKYFSDESDFKAKFARNIDSRCTVCNTGGTGTNIVAPTNAVCIICFFDRNITKDPDNAILVNFTMGCTGINEYGTTYTTEIYSPVVYASTANPEDNSYVYSALRADEVIRDAIADADYRSKDDLDYTYSNGTKTTLATMADIASIPTPAPVDLSGYLTEDNFSSGFGNIMYAYKDDNSDLVVKSGKLDNMIVKSGGKIPVSAVAGSSNKYKLSDSGSCYDIFEKYDYMFIKGTFTIQVTGKGSDIYAVNSKCKYAGTVPSDAFVFNCNANYPGINSVKITQVEPYDGCHVTFDLEHDGTITNVIHADIESMSIPIDDSNIADDKILSAAAVESLIDKRVPVSNPHLSVVYEDDRITDNRVVRQAAIAREASALINIDLEKNGNVYYFKDESAYNNVKTASKVYLKGSFEKDGKTTEVDGTCDYTSGQPPEQRVFTCEGIAEYKLLIETDKDAGGYYMVPHFATSSTANTKYQVSIEKFALSTRVLFNDNEVLSKNAVEYMIAHSGSGTGGSSSAGGGANIDRVDDEGVSLGIVDKLSIRGSSNTVYDTAAVDNKISAVSSSVTTLSSSVTTLSANIGDTATLVHDGDDDNKVVRASDLGSYLTTEIADNTYSLKDHNHTTDIIDTINKELKDTESDMVANIESIVNNVKSYGIAGSVKKTLNITCYNFSRGASGETTNIYYEIELPRAMPEFVYINADDLVECLKKTNNAFTVSDKFVYAFDFKDGAGNRYIKLNVFKKNEIILSYSPSIEIGYPFEFKNVVYYENLSICLSCTNSVLHDVTIIDDVKRYFWHSTVYELSGEIVAGCVAESSQCKDKIIKADPNNKHIIPLKMEEYTGYDVSQFGLDFITYYKKVDWELFDYSQVEIMSGAFKNRKSELYSIDFNGFDSSRVSVIDGLFAGCSNLLSADLSGLHTTSLRTDGYLSLGSLFNGCTNLKYVNLHGLGATKIGVVQYMFSGCSNLVNIDLNGLDLKSPKSKYDVQYMFSGCSKLASLDLRVFSDEISFKESHIFDGCTALRTLYMTSNMYAKIKDCLPDGTWTKTAEDKYERS